MWSIGSFNTKSEELGTLSNKSIDEVGPTSQDYGIHSARASHYPWSSGSDKDVLHGEQLCHAHTTRRLADMLTVVKDKEESPVLV